MCFKCLSRIFTDVVRLNSTPELFEVTGQKWDPVPEVVNVQEVSSQSIILIYRMRSYTSDISQPQLV